MAALVSEPPGPAGFHAPTISDAELAHFREHGYCFLGRCAPLADIEALGARIDELMLGAGADYPRMMMSVCPSETGSWDHPATRQTEGFKYPTLGYRKIQGLEEDAVFRSWVRHPLWRDVTRHVIGEHVGINRAMYFAKPAATEGVRIDWQCVHDAASALQCRAPAPACLILAYPCMPHHALPCSQDNSGDQGLQAVTVWTALDKTTLENGCLQISPGTHKLGKIEFGSTTSNDPTLPPEREDELTARKIYLPMEKGETVLLNNLMLHRSDANKSGKPRRGFSVWYTAAQPRLAQVFPEYVPRPDNDAAARL